MDIIGQLKRQALSREYINRAEQGPGVYVLFTRNNYINYVGYAANIRQRLRFHAESGGIPFSKFAVIRTRSINQAEEIEAQLIDKLEPRYNTLGGE